MNRQEAIDAQKNTQKEKKVSFSRKEAREFCMQTIFQMEAQKEAELSKLEHYLGEKNFGTQTGYIKSVISGLLENIETVDELINKSATGWDVKRMPKTDLAIVRIATAEMLYADIPHAVAINEAVSLSKLYGTENSPKFINAVLGKIEKTATK